LLNALFNEWSLSELLICCTVWSRAIQQNTLLLNEECESLRQKLCRAEERSVTLSTLEVECEVMSNSFCYYAEALQVMMLF